MKIQCPCGAKYVIDVTPGMQAVQFVCPNCGGDYSEFVNQLIQRELAENFPSASQPAQPAAPAPSAAPGLRISRPQATDAPPAEAPAAAEVCAKHREPATEHCAVCHKPICPKCMEVFGYFCSPFCKGKAEAQKMKVPSYAGGLFAGEARFWRKMGLISAIAGVLAAVGLGFWTWYAWIGSVPRTYFSASFDQISHSGSSYVDGDQIVFLHGGTLARYDMKTGQKIWSQELVSKQQIDDEVNRENSEAAAARDRSGSEEIRATPSISEKYVRIGLESALSLHCLGQNIWVADGGAGQLTHYDWNSGNSLQQIAVPDAGDLVARDNELLAFESGNGRAAIVQVDLASGQLSTNQFQDQGVAALSENGPQPSGAAPVQQDGGGLPLSPYASSQPMNPQRVARQAQDLSLQGQIALPAIVANNSYEQRIEGAMNDGEHRQRPPQQSGNYYNNYPRPSAAARPSGQSRPGNFTLIPDNGGFEEFSSQLIQANFVQREAMKAPPAKSALDSVTGGNETAVVNEQLNEMQRNNGNDKVTEDDSTYNVTVRQAGSTGNEWTGEVIGPPELFPLKTVNVLAAGKTVIVLDKSNKKLWQTELTYAISGDEESPLEQSSYGEGPCVEHDGTLYVFDQAVLSAFDLTTGNARWRIPTVGVVGLFFDDKGMMYVNTTTGNPDDIKYARQIDVSKSIEAVVLKIDPGTGKILWSATPGGYISYLSGPFMYAIQVHDPGDEEDQLSDATAGLEKPPMTRIIRISPSDGRVLWQEDQPRAAMNVQFDGSFIRIIFKKQVQVLHYLAL